MFKFLTAVLITVSTVFCQADYIIQNEEFNPGDLNEPALPFMDGTLVYEVLTDINPKSAQFISGEDSVRIVEKMGWKVQVFSTDDFYLADSMHSKVLLAFEEQDVEKVFNAPYYKIRVGNCATRSEAETLLQLAREQEFRDAWIITAKVRVAERVFKY